MNNPFNAFSKKSTQLALAVGLVLAAVSAPAFARGNGGGSDGGAGGEVASVMAAYVVPPTHKGKPKLRRAVPVNPCGGLSVNSARSCQFGS